MVSDVLEPHETGEDDLGLPPLPTNEGVEGLDDDMVPRLDVLAMLERLLDVVLCPWPG